MSAYNWMLLEVNLKKNLFRTEFSAIKWRQMTASLISPLIGSHRVRQIHGIIKTAFASY